MKISAGISALALSAGAAVAAIDGANFDSDYGAAIWSQNVGTGFGNNGDPDAVTAGGSEIDAVYARIQGGKLFLGIAGNLETNFNKLNIALDVTAGGQNQFSGLGSLGNLNGMTMDAGFDADALLSYTIGDTGGQIESFLDGGIAQDGFLGGGTAAGLSTSIGGAAIEIAINNSNTGGVGAFPAGNDSDPASVTTGVELSIDIAALGWVYGTEVRIAGWINGSNNDFLSNQVIGGLPDGTGNLGGDGAGNFTGNVGGVDFNNFAGTQYVSFVPAPGTMALVGFAGLAAARRRR